MRADRLVAALLVIQARGQVTAAELAVELEVSARTARRDLEALAMAGVPIYSRPGRGGGWSLIGGARTDLTGLTEDESTALLLGLGTASNASEPLRRAVRKLVQAVPAPFRHDVERTRERAVVDEASWGRHRASDEPEFLHSLQRALVDGRQVEMGYDGPGRGPTTRVVHPWGLVAKAGIWYLVAGTGAGRRTFRVSRVVAVRSLDAEVEIPPGFDLAEAWREIKAQIQEVLHPVRAEAVADGGILGALRHVFGTRMSVGPRRADGRHDVEIVGESSLVLAAQVAGFAGRVDVIGPEDVRAELAAVGDRLRAAYGSRSDG